MRSPSVYILAAVIFHCMSCCGAVDYANNKDPMTGSAPIPPWRLNETKEERDTRMAWWRDGKFGMFIHWGPYAVYGAVYNGKPHKNSEWIYENLKIPVAEYKETAARFQPQKFDANAWVALAKRTGQKYIVITAKHHDGFAMWPSKFGGFNIRDTAGYKGDPLAELAAACRKEGIKLGFYYSQALDWTYPGGGKAERGGWDPAQQGDFDKYFDEVAIPQVRELLTNYGPDVPAVIWFDVDAKNMNPDRVERMLKVVREHPTVILNNRVCKQGPGDYGVAEGVIPPRGFTDRDWEGALMTYDTWGYSTHHNKKWKSAEAHIRSLVDAVSKGGNALLNVPPDPDGVIPDAIVKRFEEIGAWLNVNGEAIYGAKPTCFGAEAGAYSTTEKDRRGFPKFIARWEWRCTTKPGKIFIHVFNRPSGKLDLPDVKEKITRVSLLADPDRKPLEFTQTDKGVSIQLPPAPAGPVASVLSIDIQ